MTSIVSLILYWNEKKWARFRQLVEERAELNLDSVGIGCQDATDARCESTLDSDFLRLVRSEGQKGAEAIALSILQGRH